MENKTQKPKIFLILRIIAIVLLITGIVLLVKSFNHDVPAMGESGWFEAESTQAGFRFGGITCIFISLPVFCWSFIPDIRKMSIRTAKYLQQETKDDIKDILDTNMDITRDARQETVDMLADGISKTRGNNTETTTATKKTKYCSNCGGKISATSKFCEHCGTKIDE